MNKLTFLHKKPKKPLPPLRAPMDGPCLAGSNTWVLPFDRGAIYSLSLWTA